MRGLASKVEAIEPEPLGHVAAIQQLPPQPHRCGWARQLKIGLIEEVKSGLTALRLPRGMARRSANLPVQPLSDGCCGPAGHGPHPVTGETARPVRHPDARRRRGA